jgi:hypothetical protein
MHTQHFIPFLMYYFLYTQSLKITISRFFQHVRLTAINVQRVDSVFQLRIGVTELITVTLVKTKMDVVSDHFGNSSVFLTNRREK